MKRQKIAINGILLSCTDLYAIIEREGQQKAILHLSNTTKINSQKAANIIQALIDIKEEQMYDSEALIISDKMIFLAGFFSIIYWYLLTKI